MTRKNAALAGTRVLELAGLAPVPFAGMMLADHGASVIRVDKMKPSPYPDTLARGKQSIQLELKSDEGKHILKQLCKESDVLIDPFRPGVLEKLELGPNTLQEMNPSLIVARLTGYGQTGPSAHKAGHDINYLAESGVLSLFRRKDTLPVPPVNLLGDFAAGGLLCAFGIVTALLERTKTGKGSVIDCGMVDGLIYLSSIIHNLTALKMWTNQAGTNLLDTGAPFYDIYETKDHKLIAVGAIEPQFYQALVNGLNISSEPIIVQHDQMDQQNWPRVHKLFQESIRLRTQAEWLEIFKHVDACVSPVLSMEEIFSDAHVADRRIAKGAERDSILPSFASTPLIDGRSNCTPHKMLLPGRDTSQILKDVLGMDQNQVSDLIARKVVQEPR